MAIQQIGEQFAVTSTDGKDQLGVFPDVIEASFFQRALLQVGRLKPEFIPQAMSLLAAMKKSQVWQRLHSLSPMSTNSDSAAPQQSQPSQTSTEPSQPAQTQMSSGQPPETVPSPSNQPSTAQVPLQ